MAIKLLIGGSPCTHWSIAQKNNRETEPSGMGWELFKNYLIAKEKFKPDFFLYENVKSMPNAIKEEITKHLGVEPYLINSALVSAQNRERYYWTNIENVPQPKDRGILLKDILETGMACRNDKAWCLDANYFKGGNLSNFNKQSGKGLQVAEPVALNTTTGGKSQCLRASCYKDGIRNMVANHIDKRTCVAEPVCVAQRGRYTGENGVVQQNFEARFDGKTNTITTVSKDNLVAEPLVEGKSVNLTANGGGMGAKTGLYAIPIEFIDDIPLKAVSCVDGKEYPVYQVLNGQITIKDKQYPIKLPDGFYIIRKLTVTECCQLQTLPDDYCKAVSATQAYKALGNGWTAEVIIHLLNHALKDVPRNEEIVVLSLYDGIGTGRYCLDKMGFTNVKYYAYEIDKYAMAIANDNYPDIIQCGDAFAVREDSWNPPKTSSEWFNELFEQ